ncbi:homoserine dehydrogenase [Acidaminobacter sp. JC074]|uniref:homoserine dehydrogenase n=1 Tax=Acidaminobacter sp. JC074 TaxID=2530199 RepID=UPI001F116852|nr:homoserine dehydrogenase [Acidaminobacter sp. JC074]MCH4891281.1 homoserine dehydrogenase [Acidaminobacter sp. JC074]
MTSVALLGYGTVGSGVFDLIEKNSKNTLQSYDEFINVSHVLVKNIRKHQDNKHYGLFTDSYEDVLKSDCDIVIEVMGGIHPAYEYIKSALMARKHVITANKDLIAEHGEELMTLANKYHVTLNYEASVGGSIPVLKTIKESLAAHPVKSITGILNGTTNYILSKMYNENISYDVALKAAQDAGFAEADPSSDVLGFDAARKLSILTHLSMNSVLKVKDILIDGITNLDEKDMAIAKKLGYKIKLIGKSIQYDHCLHAFVKPVYVQANSMLGLIDNEYNTVQMDLDTIGEMTFSGKGAGKHPTASAIYGDILDILLNEKKVLEPATKRPKICHYAQGKHEWLVRLYSLNQPINLEKILKFFTDGNMEIKDFENPNDLSFTIKGISESTLFEIIQKLQNLNIISVSKYFMIL